MATKNRRVAAYLPPEVDEAFVAFKIQRGLASKDAPHQNDSQALIQLLTEYLGVSPQEGYSVSYMEGLVTVQQLEALKAELKASISELSSGLLSVNSRVEALQPGDSQVFDEITSSTPGQLNLLAATDAASAPEKADGERWLTTSQAYERAQKRGFNKSKNSFKGWSQRTPDECFEMYDLRRLDHKSNSQTAPGYEDVRWKSQ